MIAFATERNLKPGSLVERWRRCRKARFYCVKPRNPGHGFSRSLTQTVSGKTGTEIMPRIEPGKQWISLLGADGFGTGYMLWCKEGVRPKTIQQESPPAPCGSGNVLRRNGVANWPRLGTAADREWNSRIHFCWRSGSGNALWRHPTVRHVRTQARGTSRCRAPDESNPASARADQDQGRRVDLAQGPPSRQSFLHYRSVG